MSLVVFVIWVLMDCCDFARLCCNIVLFVFGGFRCLCVVILDDCGLVGCIA